MPLLKKIERVFPLLLVLRLMFFFEQLKQDFYHDIIFTHYRNDFHQDHRLIPISHGTHLEII